MKQLLPYLLILCWLLVIPATDQTDCNDGDCLTLDVLNELTGQCEHTPIELPNCDDGLCNTTDFYNPLLANANMWAGTTH